MNYRVNPAAMTTAIRATRADLERLMTAAPGLDAERATRIIVSIKEQVAAQNRSGGLARFNAEYKAYRLACQQRGVAPASYSARLAELVNRMIDAAAVAHRVGLTSDQVEKINMAPSEAESATE